MVRAARRRLGQIFQAKHDFVVLEQRNRLGQGASGARTQWLALRGNGDLGQGHRPCRRQCELAHDPGLPVVTEIAVRYTRKATLPTPDGASASPQDWLRAEWLRSGLPLSQSNMACGVANAATRKYLTACRLWYWPPGEAVVAMARWCSRNGLRSDRPYFSIDGVNPPSAGQWDGLRAKWTHVHA